MEVRNFLKYVDTGEMWPRCIRAYGVSTLRKLQGYAYAVSLLVKANKNTNPSASAYTSCQKKYPHMVDQFGCMKMATFASGNLCSVFGQFKTQQEFDWTMVTAVPKRE